MHLKKCGKVLQQSQGWTPLAAKVATGQRLPQRAGRGRHRVQIPGPGRFQAHRHPTGLETRRRRNAPRNGGPAILHDEAVVRGCMLPELHTSQLLGALPRNL